VSEYKHVQLLSFWEGSVTWLERLCVASMIQHNHPVAIYTYDPDALKKYNSGAEIRDAREVITGLLLILLKRTCHRQQLVLAMHETGRADRFHSFCQSRGLNNAELTRRDLVDAEIPF
jgi:hypothetical protein